MADYTIENHGSIVMLRPLSDAARDHIAARMPEDALSMGGAYAVEPRFIGDIEMDLQNEGFEAE